MDKLAKFYGITIDQSVHMYIDIPKVINLKIKPALSKLDLLPSLTKKIKNNFVFVMIQTILTKKKFKDFFQKNISA